jgi:hypothetical protein
MITVYSTGCPNCLQLERKLKAKNINHTIENLSTEQAIEKGFSTVPMTLYNGELLNFIQIIQILNKF